MKTIALIAHDRKKEEMLNFVLENKEQLAHYELIATATTGKIIKENAGLSVTTFLSGPLGGDQQIGSRVACQKVDIVIFLRDPLTAQPHEPDITALLRICDVHNIPVATNASTARLVLQAVAKKE
ncbi:methylglyoxal synthase [Sporomusa acidovorans]|uniref:Methylglyoxal synthase n=1 Tax=Sporomusa acidovorans (strain ATCC 49682 / DSM 3132 / Mol) TaxID=1123286 RepID=A0ABZ3JBB3_SPOA4|nr:methylglyoxal synthase [Sporomusa acidovorans]OZC21641.1 methylglyoxal synthase [Sporomusa acidovorans DSM 3132]SDD61504.1 methylglyoxal synthase [Sporomusa acidovorans]